MPLHESAELRQRTEKGATGATYDASVILRRIRIDDRLAPAIGTGEFFRHGASKGILTGESELRCDCINDFHPGLIEKADQWTLKPISMKARYAASRSVPPGGTKSKGSRILTIVPFPSDPDGTILPPS